MSRLATQACHFKHTIFFEDEDASNGHTDLTLSQEDFGSVTSIDQDIVEKTDGNLDPIPTEGGEGAGQEQVRTNKRH